MSDVDVQNSELQPEKINSELNPQEKHEADAQPSDRAPTEDNVAAVAENNAPASTTEEPDQPKPKSMSVKPGSSKANGGPTTPIVKKARLIIGSGTFGSGTIKQQKPTQTTSSATKTVPAPATSLKKSASSTAAPTKTMASSKPASTTNSAPPSRRASVVPPKVASPTPARALSSSTSTKPNASSARASAMPPPESKSASATRPRASVSEGVKKTTPSAPRPSMASSKPAATPASKSAAATKPTRTAGSISSIREVREDGKALEELQNKLKETTDELAVKAESLSQLEARADELQSSLDKALAGAQAKDLHIQELEAAKVASENKLIQTTEALSKLEDNQGHGDSIVKALQEEIEAAKSASLAEKELIQDLQSQVEALEAQVVAAKENLAALKASHASETSASSAAAAVEHDALLKAQTDFAAIQEELSNLKSAHVQTLEDATAKVKDAELQAAEAHSLKAQVEELLKEKEESAQKISELEVEILELKEVQEQADDNHVRSSAQLAALQKELAEAKANMQRIVDEANAKEAEHLSALDSANALHEEAMKAASIEQEKIALRSQSLETELQQAKAAHEEALTQARAAAEKHALDLEDAHKTLVAREGELSDEIKRITAELEGQEAQYNAKVDAVKTEHATLLQEAFDRAKSDAMGEHGKDLNEVRIKLQATAEQLRAQHDLAMENLRAEHAELLESQSKALEKRIQNLTVELKATQDDLAKAKGLVESSQAELISLTSQRDEARSAAANGAEPSLELADEVARLARELSVAKDDLAAANEMLDLTKVSLSEATHNHATELEVAAKARADEVTKLRESRDQEVTLLATQKAELLTKLSDLEGELTTARASLGAEHSSPKSNGAVHPQSPGITKEELQRLHEAHNLKLLDLQAEHDKAVKLLQEELEASQTQASERQQEIVRKTLEIQYLEQDQDENNDQITRLKEENETLKEQLKAHEPAST